MKKAPKIRKKYVFGGVTDGEDPKKKKKDPNAPETLVLPTATTTDTAQITDDRQRMKIGWETKTPTPPVSLAGTKFGVLGAPLPPTENQQQWSTTWGTNPNAPYKGKYPVYFAETKDGNFYQLTFDEYSKYKTASGQGLSIPFVEPQKSAFFDQSKPYQRKAEGGKVKGYADGSVITDVNDPNYDPNLDPNSPSYDPSLAQKKGLDVSKFASALGVGSPYTMIGNTASGLVENNVDLGADQKGLVGKQAATSALKRAGQGAALGSIIPGVGTAIGAGAGAIIGGVEGLIKGKKKKNALSEDQQAIAQSQVGNNASIENYSNIKSNAIEENNKFLGVFKNGGPIDKKDEVVGRWNKMPTDALQSLVDVNVNMSNPLVKLGSSELSMVVDIIKKRKSESKIDRYNNSAPNKHKEVFGMADGGLAGASSGPPEGHEKEMFKKDGGKIKGKGTAKSDSINADIKPGSFVVPVENAKIAERIRKMYLGSPDKKANLDQSNAVPVKLSNGEHLFTPEEVVILKSKGIDLDQLAPNATEGNELAKGGPVTAQEREAMKLILQSKDPNSVFSKFDAKQKARYIELMDIYLGEQQKNKSIHEGKKGHETQIEIINNEMKKLNDIKSLMQKQDNVKTDEKLLTGDSDIDYIINGYRKQKDPYLKKPEFIEVLKKEADKKFGTYWPKGSKNPAFKEFISEYEKDLKKYNELNPPTGKQSLVKKDNNLSLKDIKSQTKEILQEEKSPITNVNTKNIDSTINKEGGSEMPFITPRTLSTDGLTDKQTVNVGDQFNDDGTLKETDVTDTNVIIDPVTKQPIEETVTEETVNKPNTLSKFYETLGGLPGVLSLGQGLLGAGQLIGSANDKPQFDIGSDVLNSQANAIAESRYGLDPTEFAKVKADINMSRAAADKQVQNYSGGNAAVALSNMRGNARGTADALKNLAIADKRIQQDKTKYADALTQGIERERMFKYQQDLNQFNLNEQSASDLMNAGISNFIGNQQLRREEGKQDERFKKYGSVFNLAS